MGDELPVSQKNKRLKCLTSSVSLVKSLICSPAWIVFVTSFGENDNYIVLCSEEGNAGLHAIRFYRKWSEETARCLRKRT